MSPEPSPQLARKVYALSNTHMLELILHAQEADIWCSLLRGDDDCYVVAVRYCPHLLVPLSPDNEVHSGVYIRYHKYARRNQISYTQEHAKAPGRCRNKAYFLCDDASRSCRRHSSHMRAKK